MNMQQIIKRSPLCLLGLLGLTLFSSPVAAQVLGLGPSTSASFDTVINVPADQNIGDFISIGGDSLATQLNLSNGGSVGTGFQANAGSEVNITGGSVGFNFQANSGSEVNISGGSLEDVVANGSVVNVSGGSLGFGFQASTGSEVNITGGSLFDIFANDSVVNFDGGSTDFLFANNSTVNITGGNTGILLDASAGSVVNISGGSLADIFASNGSVVNIDGGDVGGFFDASGGSELNISGGNFTSDLLVNGIADINVFGSDFIVGGMSLDGDLTPNQAFTVGDRDVTLTSVLADGSAFALNLDSFFLTPDANLTVTLVTSVPEPGSLTLIGLGGVILLARRRKTCR